MGAAHTVGAIATELALFAGVGFLLFAVNDLIIDLIYFSRSVWRWLTIYSRYPRAFADRLPVPQEPGMIAIFVPAWDELVVIGDMLANSVGRFEHDDFRIFVGYYRNDPATGTAISDVIDPRIQPVEVPVNGPTTKADCLNHLYAALKDHERSAGRKAKAIVLHDAEDVVHPLELKVYDYLIERSALIQLPVIPLTDPSSQWISGHYCDEFAKGHTKELVVREAIGASVPLAGVGCAIARDVVAELARRHEGRPFYETSLTEDYEVGLRVGDLGFKTMFVRMRAYPGSHEIVATRSYFPRELGPAVRQKARWLGGIALSGWDRLGWSASGWGENWMRMRDRRGPLAALLLVAGYLAAFLWSQIWFARALGAPIHVEVSSTLATLLWINLWLLAWRIFMRAAFTASNYGVRQGMIAVPRMVVGNFIAVFAAFRAIAIHLTGGPPRWEKTAHVFPKEMAR